MSNINETNKEGHLNHLTLSLLADDMLPVKETEKCLAHIYQCKACEQAYDDLQAISFSMVKMKDVEVPQELKQRIMSQLPPQDAVDSSKVVSIEQHKVKVNHFASIPWQQVGALVACALLGWSFFATPMDSSMVGRSADGESGTSSSESVASSSALLEGQGRMMNEAEVLASPTDIDSELDVVSQEMMEISDSGMMEAPLAAPVSSMLGTGVEVISTSYGDIEQYVLGDVEDVTWGVSVQDTSVQLCEQLAEDGIFTEAVFPMMARNMISVEDWESDPVAPKVEYVTLTEEEEGLMLQVEALFVEEYPEESKEFSQFATILLVQAVE